MDKFTYNMFQEIEKPTVILSSVYHKHYGVLDNIDMDSFQCTFNMNSAQEVSFDVYKYMDEHYCILWDKLISFKYIYIPSHNEYYKIDVTLDQDDKTVKHITGTSAGEWELSNRKIQSLEINTEIDVTYYEQKNEQGVWEQIPAPKNTQVTILYNPDNEKKSLLHRAIANRAPDWSIGHVDETVAQKERMFSVSNQSIYDFLTNTVAQELDILFKFDSVNRVISVYDLLNTCTNEVDGKQCGERGNFTDVCPKCGCTDKTKFIRGYGEDSHIFISADNYSNKITIDGDEGSVKNCFRFIGGDDLMTATAKNCNPSGSEYLYNFSEADYDDMPEELVQNLKDYYELYDRYMKGDPEATPPIEPYSELTKKYYNALNEYYYYKTNMMPRMKNDGNDCFHWQPTTNYELGDTCYVITLPSYCYLKCVQAGVSGHTEFDATNVIPSDKPDEYVYIDEHEIDDTATVKWEVVRHIVTVPAAAQALQQVKDYLSRSDTILYFEDKVPTGITSSPQSFSSINRWVVDLLSTEINPLFKVEVLDDNNHTSSWTTQSYFPSDPTKPKTGYLDFYLRITNTTKPEDIAQTYNTGTQQWYTLRINCAVADSLSQHQSFLTEQVKKKLDKKDTTFTSLWDVDKKKNGSFAFDRNTGSPVVIDCGFTPTYIVVQRMIYSDYWHNDGVYWYMTTYKHGQKSFNNYANVRIVDNGFRFSGLMQYEDPRGVVHYFDSMCYYMAFNDEDFSALLHQYSLDLLKGFAQSYNACQGVLADSAGDPNTDFHGVNLYEMVYAPYNDKIKQIETEILAREQTVKYYYNNPGQNEVLTDIPVGQQIPYDDKLPMGIIQQYELQMIEIHNILNIQNYLGDDWVILFNYLREGEYQNSNLISDGLSNNVLVEYGNELLDKASKELKKASELQYTLSDDLFNLLNTEDFAPFKDKFNLGDFIVCGVGDDKDNFDIDDHNYKLRLISLSYTYGSPESITLTFSNVTRIKNYFSDTQDVLAQAKSMSTTYTAVTHQVKQNNTTTEAVANWNENGLKSSLVRIMNNTQEEVSFDDNGIYIKEYDYEHDETKGDKKYSDEQLRITHNILAFTTDNWKTAKLGLGKQEYKYYNSQGVLTQGTDYGLIAKFVDAGYIRGSQIIGGDIYSENYNGTAGSEAGTYINLKDGDFTMAGGRLKATYTGGTYSVELDGSIKANSGEIAGWDIQSNRLYKETNSTGGAYTETLFSPDSLEFRSYNPTNGYFVTTIGTGYISYSQATSPSTTSKNIMFIGNNGGARIRDWDKLNDSGNLGKWANNTEFENMSLDATLTNLAGMGYGGLKAGTYTNTFAGMGLVYAGGILQIWAPIKLAEKITHITPIECELTALQWSGADLMPFYRDDAQFYEHQGMFTLSFDVSSFGVADGTSAVGYIRLKYTLS